jgi:hypothetical protein
MQLSRRRFGQAALAAALAACGQRGAQDLIIYGGPIYTGVAAAPTVEALRISNGLIAFAGALDEARSGSRAREINLNGAAAFPGFTDAHVHLTGVGMASMRLDLVGVASIAAMQESLRAYAAAHPEGPIIGRGWIETHWPERRFPTRADLDSVVGDRPVFLERIDGHAAVVNTPALALTAPAIRVLSNALCLRRPLPCNAMRCARRGSFMRHAVGLAFAMSAPAPKKRRISRPYQPPGKCRCARTFIWSRKMQRWLWSSGPRATRTCAFAA